MRQIRQPQAAPQVDWSNPITRGLISAIDGRSGMDIIALAKPTANTTALGGGTQGVGARFSSTAYETFPFANRSKIADACTYVCLIDYIPSGSPNSFVFGDTQAAGAGYNGGLYSNSTVFSCFIKTGGSGTSASGTTSTASARYNVLLGGTYDGANIRLYVNGTQEGTVAKTGNVDAGSFSLNVNRWNSANPHGGLFYYGLVWNRALSAAEMASLRGNPWQVFREVTRLKFAPTAAGTNVTLSVATENESGIIVAIGISTQLNCVIANEAEAGLAMTITEGGGSSSGAPTWYHLARKRGKR